MEAIRTHVAGVDVHKEVIAVTVIRGAADSEPAVTQFECETFTEDLMACGTHLLELGVREVALESTGVYWKPIHNVWSPMGINVTVAQAAHVKNVPGRKTDMNDSQRILEDGNIKLGTIVSDVFGKAGIQVLRALAKGETDAKALAACITTKIKRRDEARKALTNCFNRQHTYLIRELFHQFNYLEQKIHETDKELYELSKPYHHLVDKLKEIPGFSDVLAIGVIAEATDQMDHFEDERKFAAWAGVAAGNNESAGKKSVPNAARVIRT